uniref:Zinc knuckle domain-containing protein n=1 Tax=Callithrix jacchus TaxID=9483 RepID=F6RXS9_CALJA|nr:putative protein FAM90A5P [Callithrix jacchus]
MAHRDPKRGANRLMRAQTLKKQQRAPAGPKAPPPDEENPRVKCKDCGAFGHTTRSTRCPMKCWNGALVLQTSGKKEGKENLNPGKPRVEGNPGPWSKGKGEDEERPRPQEQQRKALLQIISGKAQAKQLPNRKESTEPCDYLRVASRPMPIHTTKRRPVVDPALTDGSAPKIADRGSTWASLSPLRKASVSSSSSPGPTKLQMGGVAHIPQAVFRCHGPQPLSLVKPTNSHPEGGCRQAPQAASSTHGLKHVIDPQAQAKCLAVTLQPCPPATTHSLGLGSNLSFRRGAKRPAQAPIQACLSSPKKARLGPAQIPKESIQGGELGALETLQPLPALTELGPSRSPQVSRRTPPWVPSIDLQPLQSRPCLPTVQACTMSHLPEASQDGDQPLRMLFRRLEDGGWSSRFLTAPSSHSLEEPGAILAQSPRVLEKSEGPRVCLPPSVLYEDLQVSSSSDEELD